LVAVELFDRKTFEETRKSISLDLVPYVTQTSNNLFPQHAAASAVRSQVIIETLRESFAVAGLKAS